MKSISEPRAWRMIAEKLLNNGYVWSGVCYEVKVANIPFPLRDAMLRRLEFHVPSGDFAYDRATHHEERAMACLWMALEAKADGPVEVHE